MADMEFIHVTLNKINEGSSVPGVFHPLESHDKSGSRPPPCKNGLLWGQEKTYNPH